MSHKPAGVSEIAALAGVKPGQLRSELIEYAIKALLNEAARLERRAAWDRGISVADILPKPIDPHFIKPAYASLILGEEQ